HVELDAVGGLRGGRGGGGDERGEGAGGDERPQRGGAPHDGAAVSGAGGEGSRHAGSTSGARQVPGTLAPVFDWVHPPRDSAREGAGRGGLASGARAAIGGGLAGDARGSRSGEESHGAVQQVC